MPKRHNVRSSEGGADIATINALHDLLVKASHQALKNEMSQGEIKASTLNSIRQICADAGVNPSREASHAMEGLLWALPQIDPDTVAASMVR